MDPSSPKHPAPIITIGSGNVEYILVCEEQIDLGEKHLVQPLEFIGGSCVNYTMRLIAAGYNVFPIPLIGDDQNGKKIREKLVEHAIAHHLLEEALDYTRSDDSLIRGFCTPKTTVLIHGGRRTIFSEIPSESISVHDHVLNRLKVIVQKHAKRPLSILIGHITQDRNENQPAAITKSIIDIYTDKDLLYANFGHSQLKHGIELWQNDLQRIDLIQLNLAEIRKLFNHRQKKTSLQAIIEWLKAHSVSAVITLSRFGAIGTYKNGENGIVLAWPLKTEKPVDPTGAGDAFAAGMVASLKGNKNFSFDDFTAAIETGRSWATYACMTIGASENCPTLCALAEFSSRHSAAAEKDIQIMDAVSAERILNLFDEAY